MRYLPCFIHILVNHGDGVTPDVVSVDDELMDGELNQCLKEKTWSKMIEIAAWHLGAMNLNRMRRERMDQGYLPVYRTSSTRLR